MYTSLSNKKGPSFSATRDAHAKSVKAAHIKLHALRFIPTLYTLYRSPLTHTISKAFLVSRRATYVVTPLMLLWAIVSCKVNYFERMHWWWHFSHACINAQSIHTPITYTKLPLLIDILGSHLYYTLFEYCPYCFNSCKQERYIQLIWSISSQCFSMS